MAAVTEENEQKNVNYCGLSTFSLFATIIFNKLTIKSDKL